MSNWSKEDINHFNNSEVMRELEGSIIKTVNRISILDDKIAQQKALVTREEIENVNKLNRALNETVQMVDKVQKINLADDENISDLEEDQEVEDEEASAMAKKEIVDELTRMAGKAVSQGHFKLAYDIERTIDELNEVEVLCD